MDIQYLNGIDIQYLNGTDAYSGPLDARQVSILNRIGAIASEREKARRSAISALTHGVTNQNAYKAEQLAVGADLMGFKGDGSVEDEEKLRQYLVHTKEVADASPVMVSAYQNPKMLSQMIGHVLANWDTANREDAIDNIIEEEKRLQGLGAIADVDNGRKDISQESFTDADVYMYGLGEAKNSFFSSIKKSLRPNLTTEAQDIVSANPATMRLRNTLRKKNAQAREAYGKATTANTSDALSGVDDDVQMLLSGDDLQYTITGENPMISIARYLVRTKRVALTHPEYFENEEESKTIANACDILLRSWNNEQLRNAAFDSIIMVCDDEKSELNGKLRKKLKKAIKKVASGVKKATKAVATTAKKAAKAVAKVAKKVGKAIAKVAKKVWKLVVRFNPLTLLIRAGILGFCRLNMFKVANKCYIGSLSKEEALKKGATADEWEKSNKAYGHLKNAYTKLGGKESKLKSTLAKGNKKKWSGTEYPTDGNAIKAAANAVNAADNKEAQADMDYDETLKDYQSKGYVSDNTVATDTATVSKQEQITIIENERTAKQASKLYETDDTKGKVLITIPKGAKVLVDTKQTSGNLIASTYNGKNGWVTKSELAGLGACDAESCAVLMAGTIYDDMSNGGLGEPATATAVSSASSVIASIMAKIKTIFGVASKAVNAVKAVKENVVDKVKSIKAVKDTINTVNDVKNTVNDVKSGVKAVQNVATSAKNIVAKGQDVVKSTATTAQNTISKVQNVANNVKNVVNQVKTPTASIIATQTTPTTTPTAKARTQATANTTQQQTTTTQPMQQNASVSNKLSLGAKIGIGIGALALVGLSVYALKKR